MEQLTKERFLEDVKNHSLDIVKNDGLYRHIICSNNGDWHQKFIIITFPNGLLITGDMGTYEFERCEDMFKFFRSGINDSFEININPGYWSEKCNAESIFGNGIREFSSDLFRECVTEYFDNYFEEETKESIEVWEEIEDRILSAEDNEFELVSALNNFTTYGIDTEFDFCDFWENTCTEKTYNFIWCLYAIVWCIREYDNKKD